VVVADDVFNQEWPGVATGTLRYMSQGGTLVPFAIGFNKVFFASPEYVEPYRDLLQKNFDDRYLTVVKMSDFAAHDILIISRVPRRPRQIVGRNKLAKQMYLRVQDLRGH
jgi:hypothetical protein